MGISRRAYAAHRKERGLPGGSHTAVNKAIETGRISILPDGSIDPAWADTEWASATDPAFQRTTEAQQRGLETARATAANDARKPVPASAVEAVQSTVAEAAAEMGGGLTLPKIKIADMAIRVKRQTLRYKVEAEQYVDKKAAEQHVFEGLRAERDHWLQLPARVAAQMASDLDCDAHALEVLLDAVIREHLAIRAETKIDLSPSKV